MILLSVLYNNYSVIRSQEEKIGIIEFVLTKFTYHVAYLTFPFPFLLTINLNDKTLYSVILISLVWYWILHGKGCWFVS